MYTDHYNKYDEGIADFRVYLKVHPNHKDAMYNMGVAFYKKQSLDSAIFILNKVIRIHPDYAAAHFLMALICAQQHNYAEAVRFGQQAEALGHAVEPRLLHDWEELAKSK
jgi:tetratricopeptide (TPR) repeat protein